MFEKLFDPTIYVIKLIVFYSTNKTIRVSFYKFPISIPIMNENNSYEQPWSDSIAVEY